MRESNASMQSSRPKEFVLEDDAWSSRMEDLQGSCHIALELLTWEEAAQVPSVPPASPSTPFLGSCGRSEAAHRLAIQGFLHGLPTSLRAVSGEPPLCQSLLSRLDESEVEVDVPWPACQAGARSSPLSPSPTPITPDSLSAPGTLRAESPVPLSLEASLLDVSADDAEHLVSEADELLLDLRSHRTVWPPQTVLCMEDYLSRSYDIDLFWFFEVRDLANTQTARERKFQEPLDSIPEYPPNWPQWQIESVRSRSAMRARKRSPRSNHKDAEASTSSS